MAKQNPSTDKSTPKDEIVEGLDRLPITTGINQKNVEIANAMPDVNMTPNNGGGPSIASPAFANGKDLRNFEGGPRSAAAPGKGAGGD